ncbi:hypothetical protein Taro_023024 [Colocasia esculenta]|uniref:Uncharacterized protein n=1 Tax=Colocasia esculenta TaxID=4460 RepID=A0A843UW77_COLES|nr:hypothetical protein [Colocasia esculenta]
MEEERPQQLFDLYDFFWFRHQVLLSSPFPAVPIPEPEVASPPAAVAATESSSTGATQVSPRQKLALRRTLSDEVTLATSSDSALLTRRPLKLQAILSGKEASDEEMEEHGVAVRSRGCKVEKLEARADEIDGGHGERKRRHRERRRTARGATQEGQSKSLSELEFKELKGFMDLGFTFPEAAESDQRLLSIVPGLRRRASSEEPVAEAEEGEGGGPEEPAIARPYLSEAWNLVADYQERRGSSAHDHLLRNWRVPAAGEGIDMKDHLRSWAHTVASAVR